MVFWSLVCHERLQYVKKHHPREVVMRIRIFIGLFLLLSLVFFGCKGRNAESNSSDGSSIEKKIDAAAVTKMAEAQQKFLEGADLYDKNHFSQAIEKFEEVKKQVNIPVNDYYLGLSYLKVGQEKKTFDLFEKSIGLYKADISNKDIRFFVVMFYLYNASITLGEGDYSKALQICDEGKGYAGEGDRCLFEEVRTLILLAKAETETKI